MIATIRSDQSQRHQRVCNARISSTWCHRRLFTLLLVGLFVVFANAIDEKTVHSSPASPSSTLSSHKDEIYIDDEGIDGSGGHGGIHDDLEKDPDYSGSGFGPDDEDSSTDQHHRRPSIHTQSKHNNNDNINNNDLISGRTHQTNSGTHQIIGGGSGGSESGQSGNSGFISGAGGVNTIGKNKTSSSKQPSLASNTPTTRINDNNLNINQHSHHTTSLYPIDTHNSQSSLPVSPHHTDSSNRDRITANGSDDNDDGIDLDETEGDLGSGYGGMIDRHDIDDDDDHTGDDNDGDDDIIHGHRNYNLNLGVNNRHKDFGTTDNEDDTTNIDEEGSQYHKQHVEHLPQPPSTHHNGFDDDNDDYDESESDGDGDDDDNNDGDDDDGTEMYTDVTDPISSSETTTTHKRPGNQGNIHELDKTSINSLPPDTKVVEHTTGNEVFIMSDDDRTTSFFAQPGILAAIIGGAVVGLLCAILVVMFIVYRMRKKDEGSYALDEPKRSPAVNSYAKNANNREFYA